VGQQALNSQEQLRLQLLVQAETKEERDGDAEGHADVVEEMLLDVVDRCQEHWDDLIRKATKGKAVGYGPSGVEYEPFTSAEKVLLLGSGAAVIASCAVATHMALATKRYLHRKMPSWKGPWAARWE